MTSANIKLNSVSKGFHRVDAARPRSWKQLFIRGLKRHRRVWFWAVREISLEVRAGEMLGILGRNGAGKSTLMKLIGRVFNPEAGTVLVNGRIGALYELSAGFHPDLSGRDNLNIVGILTGYDRRELRRKREAIIDFAELGEVIDSPLRTYSSGMRMRLAFALAVHFQPEVVLVDEVLSVGDERFRRKCLERIKELRESGSAVVLVTHDVSQVQRHCSRGIWLEEGRPKMEGDPGDVVHAYLKAQSKQTETQKGNGTTYSVLEKVASFSGISIKQTLMFDQNGREVTRFDTGDRVVITIDYERAIDVECVFSVSITTVDGDVRAKFNTASSNFTISRKLCSEMRISLVVDRLEFASGSYYVSIGCYSPDWGVEYDHRWRTLVFNVSASYPGGGPQLPRHYWSEADI